MKRDKSITWQPRPVDTLNLSNRRVAIVGGTGGIGRAIARQMAQRGAHVTVVGRSFRDKGVSGIDFVKADLSLMREARRVAEELPAEQLDLLIFTAGIMAGPKRQESAEGIELDLATSYLNRFVMQRIMAPRLGRDRADRTLKPRIFNVAFPGSGQTYNLEDPNAERKYARWDSHSNTVAGNEVLVLEGAHAHPDLALFGLNPGFVKTNIRSNLFGSKWILGLVEGLASFMTTDADAYASTIVPLMVSADIEHHSGAMFDKKARAIRPSVRSTDADYRQAVMRSSEQLVAQAGISL